VLSEIHTWNEWRSRCLSYLLDKRTIRLLSGANLIFSAPKIQWVRVFEPLKVPTDANNDNLLEIMVIPVSPSFCILDSDKFHIGHKLNSWHA